MLAILSVFSRSPPNFISNAEVRSPEGRTEEGLFAEVHAFVLA